MAAKATIKNIFAYIQGNIRYKLYYSKFYWMIPSHILHQIEVRINSMDKQCYSQGSCTMCGCKTTALQMSNKACDKPCYPEMMNKGAWKSFKKSGEIIITNTKGYYSGMTNFRKDIENKNYIKWKLINNTFLKDEQLENK